jgi:hypothetical protein
MGAIEIKELAAELSSVAPQFADFGGGATAAGLAELGASFQIARNAFGSAAEARTGLMSLMTQLIKKREMLADKRYNVRVFDEKGNQRAFEDIRADLRKLSTTQLTDVLQESGAIRTAGVLNDNYEKLNEIKRDSANSNATEADSVAYLSSEAGKIDKAMNSAKLAIAEAFTPERIVAFTKALGAAGEGLAAIVGFFDHLAGTKFPWEKADEKQDKHLEDVEKRRLELTKTAAEKHGDTALIHGGMDPMTYIGGAAPQTAMYSKHATAAERKAIDEQMRSEGIMTRMLGGTRGTGAAGGKGTALVGDQRWDTQALIGLSDYVKKAGNPEMSAAHAAAIGRAVADSIKGMNAIIQITNDAEAFRVSMANAWRGSTRMWGH